MVFFMIQKKKLNRKGIFMDNNIRKFVDKFTMFAAKLGKEILLRALLDEF